MSSKHTSLFLITTITIITIISSSNFISPTFSTLQSNTLQSNYTSFVKTLCNTTTYPSLCRKTCIPYASKIALDTRKLALSALNTTLSTANSASSAFTKLSLSKHLTKFESNVVRDCMDNMGDSIDYVKQSIEEINDIIRIVSSKSNDSRSYLKFKVSNIMTWMSACVTNQNTCMESVEEGVVTPYVKDKLTKNILMVSKLTRNSLSLCNHLL